MLKALDVSQIQPVELGGNPLRLHCMPAWLNLNDLQPVFEGGQIQPDT